MKVRAIIQARMGSSRLRGKSLMPVAGVTLLTRVFNSVRNLPFIDEIMVATTLLPEDDPIKTIANENNIKVYRGDALNVLKRFKDASNDMEEGDSIVRFTADNPLNWARVSNELFEHHINNKNDYTCIDGLSHIVCEIFTVRALRDVTKMYNLDDFDKEHVTPYFRKHKENFKVEILPFDFMGLRHDLDKYLTIDTSEDLFRFEDMEKDVNIDVPDDFRNIYNWLEKNVLKIDSNDNKDNLFVNLDGTRVGENYPTYIVAEIGQNHNGDIRIAKKLIDMAVRAGANAVKFQKRDIPSDLTKEAYDKPYDNPNSFGATYGEHREFLELSKEEHKDLREYALARGITYFCTPTDIPSLEIMEEIGTPFYKVASRDLTNIPLLQALKRTGKPIIISTGMATLEDIDDAVKTLDLPKDKLLIMQCTSEYPCKLEHVNLKAMETLKERYGYQVGLSDHTSGVIVSAAASTLGAVIIEKHVTLDRTMKGTDQPGSLEEQGLKKLVEYIRAVELAMGDGQKEFNPAITKAKKKLARSLTSKVEIKKDTIITEEMLTLKSPGDGILWRDRGQIVGKKSKLDIKPDITLKYEYFE